MERRWGFGGSAGSAVVRIVEGETRVCSADVAGEKVCVGGTHGGGRERALCECFVYESEGGNCHSRRSDGGTGGLGVHIIIIMISR